MRDARELFEQRVEHAETVDEGKAKVNAREVATLGEDDTEAGGVSRPKN